MKLFTNQKRKANKETINKSLSLVIILATIFTLLSPTIQQCNSSSGCLQRNKFLVYTTGIGSTGEISNIVSDVNFKIVYMLNTGISIMDSTNPNDKIMEQETGSNYGSNTSRLIRKIPYGLIVMDCGKFRNKLCLIGDYPDKDRLIKAKEGIKKSMSENLDSNCIVIPFFEFGYSNNQDKIAILCLPESKDLYDVVKYRDFLSMTIETLQINEANNRSSTFNSISRESHKCITYNSQKMSVAVNTLIKSNIIYMWNDDSTWVNSYSLFELKNSDGFACPVSTAISKKPEKLKDWNLGLKPQPRSDCCLFLGGEAKDLLLCIADDSGSLETNDEICKAEMKQMNIEIHDFVYRAKILNALTILDQDEAKRNECSSSSWNVMRNRIQAAADWALNNCKKFFTNISDSRDSKTEKCKGQYLSALEHETDFLVKKKQPIEKMFNKCVKEMKTELYTPEWLLEKVSALGGSSNVGFFFKQKFLESEKNKDKEYDSKSIKSYYNNVFPFYLDDN